MNGTQGEIQAPEGESGAPPTSLPWLGTNCWAGRGGLLQLGVTHGNVCLCGADEEGGIHSPIPLLDPGPPGTVPGAGVCR